MWWYRIHDIVKFGEGRDLVDAGEGIDNGWKIVDFFDDWRLDVGSQPGAVVPECVNGPQYRNCDSNFLEHPAREITAFRIDDHRFRE